MVATSNIRLKIPRRPKFNDRMPTVPFVNVSITCRKKGSLQVSLRVTPIFIANETEVKHLPSGVEHSTTPLMLLEQQEIVRAMQHREVSSVVSIESITKTQTFVTMRMREILVDWLIEVTNKSFLHSETIALAVIYLDRFLSVECIAVKQLQLLGIATLLLASKVHEVKPPTCRHLVERTGKAYTKKQLVAMEAVVWARLQFRVTHVTSFQFVDTIGYLTKTHAPDTAVFDLTRFLLWMVLQHHEFLAFRPSILACSAMLLAMTSTEHTAVADGWDTSVFMALTGYCWDSLEPCTTLMHATATGYNGKYRSVWEIFSTPQQSEAARIVLRMPGLQCSASVERCNSAVIQDTGQTKHVREENEDIFNGES